MDESLKLPNDDGENSFVFGNNFVWMNNQSCL
jgi:hypothetical protein